MLKQWKGGSILVGFVLLAACNLQGPDWHVKYVYLDGVWQNADQNAVWSFDLSRGVVTIHYTYSTDEEITRFKIHDLTDELLQMSVTLRQIRPSRYSESERVISDAPESGSYYFVVNAEGFLVQLDIFRERSDSSETLETIAKFSEYIIRDRDYFSKYHQITPSITLLNNELEAFVSTHAITKHTNIESFDQTIYVKNIYVVSGNEYQFVDTNTVVHPFIIYDQYGNYRWQLENNRFEQPGSTPTPEERALLDDGWELQKVSSPLYFPRTYTIEYDAGTQTLTLHDASGYEAVLTRKED